MNLVLPPDKFSNDSFNPQFSPHKISGDDAPSQLQTDEENRKKQTSLGIANWPDTLYIPPSKEEKITKGLGDSLSNAWNTFSNGVSSAWNSVSSGVSSAWDSFVNFCSNGFDKFKSVLGLTKAESKKELQKSFKKSHKLQQAEQQELMREIEANLAKLDAELKKDFEGLYHLTMNIARQVKKSNGLIEESHIEELQEAIRRILDKAYELQKEKQKELDKQSFWKDVTKATSIFGTCINVVLGITAVAAVANPVGAAILGTGVALSAGLQVQNLLGNPLEKWIAEKTTSDEKQQINSQHKAELVTGGYQIVLSISIGILTGNGGNLATAALSAANNVSGGVSKLRQTQLDRNIGQTTLELKQSEIIRQGMHAKLSQDDLKNLEELNRGILSLIEQQSEADEKKKQAISFR